MHRSSGAASLGFLRSLSIPAFDRLRSPHEFYTRGCVVAMDISDIVAGTREAAFATNGKGSIIAWNKAAEQLLGYQEQRMLGNHCYQVICGTDLFGNRFCDKCCPLANMARRQEKVGTFEIDVRAATSEIVRTRISIIVVRGRASSEFAIIHLVQPLEQEKEARDPAAKFLLPGKSPGLLSSDGSNQAPLTPRETDVLRLLVTGSSTKEIAHRLFISVTTVRNHIQNILRKLNVHSRLEAVSFAHRNRFI